MAGNVDGDIDPIGTELGAKRGVVETKGLPPDPAALLKGRRNEIGFFDLGITISLDLGRIVMGEQRLEKEAHRVIAEIGREIGDTQAPLGLARVDERRRGGLRFPYFAYQPIAPFAMPGKNLRR